MANDTPVKNRDIQAKQWNLGIEIMVIVAIALLTIFLVPPALTAIGQAFRIKLLGRFLSLAIVALGIDLIWGYTGLLSLGHGLFFALGGYAFAMYLQLQLPLVNCQSFSCYLEWKTYPLFGNLFTPFRLPLLPC
jgi:urea transport system permease protein